MNKPEVNPEVQHQLGKKNSNIFLFVTKNNQETPCHVEPKLSQR